MCECHKTDKGEEKEEKEKKMYARGEKKTQAEKLLKNLKPE